MVVPIDDQAISLKETLAHAVELAELLYAIPAVRQSRGSVEIDTIHLDRKFYLRVKCFHYSTLVWVHYYPERGFDIGEVMDDVGIDLGEFCVLPGPYEGQITTPTLDAIAGIVADGIDRWLNREVEGGE